jgi:hypothetical protein
MTANRFREFGVGVTGKNTHPSILGEALAVLVGDAYALICLTAQKDSA